MAVISVNFNSDALLRKVNYLAIVPTDAPADLNGKKDKGPYRTVYLLHGFTDDYHSWIQETRIVSLAMKYHIAVIMPDGCNSFYVDQECTDSHFGEYIGKELVEATRALFPLSHERKDTFIGGLSMGGYGAIRNGLKYNKTFGAIVGLSSALIEKQVVDSKEDSAIRFDKRSYYKGIFGNLENLLTSDKYTFSLVKMLKEKKESFPRIFMACGTEDFLIENNRALRDYFKSEGVDITYYESPGVHEWGFWDKYIEKAIPWLLKTNK